MKIESVRSLRGPNLWSNQTVLEALASFDGAEPLAQAQRFAQRILELQAAVGCQVSFYEVRPVSERQCRLIVQYTEEEVGRRALELALSEPLSVPVEQVRDLPTLRAL